MKFIKTSKENKKINNLIKENNVIIDKLFNSMSNGLFKEYLDILERVGNWWKFDIYITLNNDLSQAEYFIEDNFIENNKIKTVLDQLKINNFIKIQIPVIYWYCWKIYVNDYIIKVITNKYVEYMDSYIYWRDEQSNFRGYLKENYPNVIIVDTSNIKELILKIQEYIENNFVKWELKTTLFSILKKWIPINLVDNNKYIASSNSDNIEAIILNKIEKELILELNKSNDLSDNIRDNIEKKLDKYVLGYVVSNISDSDREYIYPSTSVMLVKEFKELYKKRTIILNNCLN